MLSQWIEFTPEEEAALDQIWEEIIAEEEAKRTAERERVIAMRQRTRKYGMYVHELTEAQLHAHRAPSPVHGGSRR